MNAMDLIAARLAAPMTHRVTTVYADGTTKTHDARSAGAAENWATGERRKIGRRLINRETGAEVMVVAVEIEAL